MDNRCLVGRQAFENPDCPKGPKASTAPMVLAPKSTDKLHTKATAGTRANQMQIQFKLASMAIHIKQETRRNMTYLVSL